MARKIGTKVGTKVGEMKAWAIRNEKEDFYRVEDPEDAFKLINNMADADLRNDAIHSNAFGLLIYGVDAEEHSENGWREWTNSEGKLMDELIQDGEFRQ